MKKSMFLEIDKIFVTIAFYGLVPIIPLIIEQIISKNIIGFLDTPWFVWYKKMLRRLQVKEGFLFLG